jgi:hypothetical protein
MTTSGHTFIGTSNDGNSFNTAGYQRFVLYVPSSSSRILFDAIGLDSQWVESNIGDAYALYTSNMNPTGSSWAVSDTYIEGAPDGNTMENSAGTDAYFGFTTYDASTLVVHVKQ